MSDETFDIQAFKTQSGVTIDLELASRVYGSLGAAKGNLIV